MKTWVKIAIPVGVLAVVLVLGGWFLFLRDDAPERGSLDAARESITTTTASGSAGSVEPAEPGSDGISGTWTVDTATGDFDFQSATGTFVGFRVDEELAGIGSTTAVGRTGDVDGTITIEGSTLTAATFTADLSTLTTDRSQRDSRMHSALDTDQFPTATFTLTEPVDLGAGAADGEEIHVEAVGELTVKGVTKPVTVALDGVLDQGTIAVYGSTQFTFDDFGIEKPTAPIVASLADDITLEMQLLFTRD